MNAPAPDSANPNEIPLRVWIAGCTASATAHLPALRQSLEQAGLEAWEPPALENACGPGALLLDRLDDAILADIQRASQNAAQRVVALATDVDLLNYGGAWKILHAGASDALAIDRLAEPGRFIRARLERWRQVDELIDAPEVSSVLIGASRAWRTILRQIIEAARFTTAPVLLEGETGTGKELAARMIHRLDPTRSARQFEVLDCTTIVPDLSGSELFGHERGAFTGALSARDGAFANADGGVLFLDEVGELSPDLQVQLLRVLQERTYKRVGSGIWRTTDFRLVCATNRDLLAEMEAGRFRRDLYYRIASWTIHLPPLRERSEDILPLARHFIRQATPARTPPDLDEMVVEFLSARAYPGNVRDLKNLVTRILTLHPGTDWITIGDTPADERPIAPAPPAYWPDLTLDTAIRQALTGGACLRELTHAIKASVIRIALEDESGDLERVAQRLKVSRRLLEIWRKEEAKKLF